MPGTPGETGMRRRFGRRAYGAVIAGLATGILLDFARLARPATFVLVATCGLLVALPVINVLFVIADEVRRRDWIFATLAFGVLLLLAWTLAGRLFGVW